MHPTPSSFRPGLRPVCLAIAALVAHAAQAQDAPAAPAAPAPAASAAESGKESLSAVVVTGSRIRGVAPVGAVVTAMSRDDIETSGATTTAQIVQELPQVFNLGVSENSRGQSGGAGNITYGASINLRGIGPYATLTLVNGHRVVGQGTSGATVDPNILPSLALERIEIVADGASALYGSDAVAGVANLIMRRNEKGEEAYARFGFGADYHEHQLGGLVGTKWSGGNATFTYENTLRSELSGKDRDFYTGNLLSQGGGDFRSTQCAPGNIVIGANTYPIPAGGVTAANAASLVAGIANKCDNLKLQDLLPEQERNSLAFTANQKINDIFSLYADGFATRRTYTFQPGALASNLTVPSTNAFYVRPPGAAAGSSETVAYSFVNDLPVNTANGKSTTVEGTIGFDANLPHDWKAGALYTHGNDHDISVTLGGLNNAAIATALADSNPATALNVFGGANNPATLAKIANNVAYSPGTTTLDNVVVKGDGPLLALPGGLMRAAVGLEWQKIHVVGGQTTGPATAPTFGQISVGRDVKSAYGELLVPLFGDSNGMPGLRKLALSLAARTDSYSDVGSTTNPKVGISWVPVDDVTVRASYGQSFRAPGLTQIHGLTNGGKGGLFVQNYSDPTQGGKLVVGVALSASNLNLKPETSTTKTLGLDWTPKIGDHTKLSLTYFDIAYNDQIVGYLSDLTILNREASFAGTSVIQRNPSPALVAQLLATYPISGVPPATWTLFVDGSNYNLGRSLSQGFDFQASTRLLAETLGDFAFGASGTVFTKYMVAATPAGAPVDQLNTIYNPLKFKSRLSMAWNYGNVQSNLALNYTNGYKNNLANPVQNVSSNTTIDARVAYNFEGGGPLNLLKDAQVAFGVVNLFNRKPPFVNVAESSNGGGGFDPTLTNPIGRIVSVSLDKHF